jgi:thiol-disulfide isomerase/thioredoxin
MATRNNRNYMKKWWLFFLYFVALSGFSTVDNDRNAKFPDVGDPCPDFLFNDIRYYPQKECTLKDFKGKWLILDCWNRYCSVCVASFPRTDSLQKAYKSSVQFLLVGYSGSQYTPWRGPDERPIKDLYEKTRTRFNLDLPVAFDSVLFHKFGISGCPFIIIINPDGMIRAITTHLTANNLDEILAGRLPKLSKPTRISGDQ